MITGFDLHETVNRVHIGISSAKRAANPRRTTFCHQGIIHPACPPPRALHPPYTITMRSLSPALASLANVFRIPMRLMPARPTVTRVCHETLARRPSPQLGPVNAAVQSAPFSSTSALAKRKGQGHTVDKRISTFNSGQRMPLASIARSPSTTCPATRPHPRHLQDRG